MAKKFLGAIISVIIAQMAGAIGSIFTYSSVENWYAFLEKPFFTPPGWLFAPAWITLYTLMGIAAYLVWSSSVSKKAALGFYAAQLVLNSLWSIIFFGFQAPFWAFLEITLLWLLVAITTVKFYRINKTAGYLFLPYILWVSFALVLNFSVWWLNM